MRYNNTSATTCAAMHREEKNGTTTATLNGTAETTAVKDEYITHPRPERTNYNQGGRLKFFKDGKFILELERAREGERVSWVSVPRKTFWPPQSTPTSTPTYRQESSTSLSVSDDNSSIQSSPWQRDHSWKQTTPQRNLSKPLCFYFRRSRHAKTSTPSSGSQSPVLNLNSHRKCHYRRPYHDINVNVNCDTSPQPENMIKCEAVKYRGKFRSMGLLAIVQSLVERIGVNASVSGAIVNGISSLGAIRTPPRQDVIVSPRKRFLREMDRDNKVTLEDNCQKRSRSKQTTTLTTPTSSTSVSLSSTPITPTSIITTSTSAIPLSTPNTTHSLNNGTTSSSSSSSAAASTTLPSTIVASTTTTQPQQRSSYSITSLLSDDRPSGGSNRGGVGRKVSPVVTTAGVITNTTPSHGYLGFGAGVHHGVPPSVEERLYTENVDRLRSIELSHADKRAAAQALSYTSLHSPLPPPGPIAPPLPPSYAAYLPYHPHLALYHPHHYPTAPSTPSPTYYAALYAAQYQQSVSSSSGGSRPSPYPPNLPYALPALQPPPPTSSRLLSGLHPHHSSSSSVWTTPSALRQAGATVLPPPPAMTSSHPGIDLTRLHHQHPAALVAAVSSSTSSSASAGGGNTVHNDALSDMPLNLSKNAG